MTGAADSSSNFEKIKEEYLKTLPEKIFTIDGLIRSLKKEVTQQAATDFRFHVHKIAGNAGTFGFQQATDLCKTWDAKLTKSLENFSAEEFKNYIPELDSFLQQLKQALGQS